VGGASLHPLLTALPELAALRHPTGPPSTEDVAGHCKAKVHQLDTLGIGGRRVLVSRDWSGKTLADHRYDQLAWVRQTLRLGLTSDGELDEDQVAIVDAARRNEAPAPIAWEMARPDDADVPGLGRRLLRMISTRIQHREAIRAAEAARGRTPDVSASAGGGSTQGRGTAWTGS